MDIPEDSPRRAQKKGTRLPIAEGDIIVSSMAGELLTSQGSVSALAFMRERHLESEGKRVPGSETGPDGTKIMRGRNETGQSGIEAFLSSDHKSHLSRVVELEEQIAKTQRAVEIIDETDFSGRTLYDFIPDEVKADLNNQLVSLKDRASIKTSVEGEISSICGDLWEDYRTGKDKSKKENQKLTETLLLGPNPSPEERKDLKSCSKEVEEVEQLGELIGLEKVRLMVRALTATTKDYNTKAAEAEKILGPEFQLIKEQVTHMEQSLEMDWARAEETGKAIINQTEGQDLVADSIKARMEPVLDKNGNPTNERKFSKEQLAVLDSAYENATARKTDSESPRDRLNRKITFVLAAAEMVELGKRAKMANLLKTVRELDNPEIKIGEETTPERQRLSGWLREKGVAALKGLVRLPKKGVAAAMKAAPQAIVVGVAAKMWQHSKVMHERHYGKQEEFVAFMKECMGEANHIA